jgi:hypothetical protein
MEQGLVWFHASISINRGLLNASRLSLSVSVRSPNELAHKRDEIGL